MIIKAGENARDFGKRFNFKERKKEAQKIDSIEKRILFWKELIAEFQQSHFSTFWDKFPKKAQAEIDLLEQKKESQNDHSHVYDLTALLPFIISGDDDPETWDENKVSEFVETVKKAGEEISADQVPKNSPAGEYRSKIYGEVKEGLQKIVKTYESKPGKNNQRVWAICDFLLFSLGWDENNLEDDLTEEIVKRIEVFADSGREINKPACLSVLEGFEKAIAKNVITGNEKATVIHRYIKKEGYLRDVESVPSDKTIEGWIDSYSTQFYSNNRSK